MERELMVSVEMCESLWDLVRDMIQDNLSVPVARAHEKTVILATVEQALRTARRKAGKQAPKGTTYR